MSTYYTMIMLLVMISMLSMIVCVSASGTVSKKTKPLFVALFSSVIISAFCEWFGISLQGTGNSTRVLHIIVKAIELSVAPAIGFLIADVIENKNKRFISAFLISNAVLEILSGIFGFIYSVDSNSVYTHAGFYWIYVAVYIVSILYGIYIVVRNINKYQYSGTVFFIMIVLFLLFGITVQLCNSELKVDYITVAIASIMLYVFTLEMIQQTDTLTGLLNRRGYENYLGHFEENGIVLMFDVDNFKLVNDRYGHHFGDVCLKEVGNALKANYAKYGRCFRIGGDEFCVIIKKELDQVEKMNSDFFNIIDQARKKEARIPYVSVGYGMYHTQTDNIQDVLQDVDQMMYKYKQEHRNKQANRIG